MITLCHIYFSFCFILACLTSLMLLTGSWRHVDFLPDTAQKLVIASLRGSSLFTLASALQAQLWTNAQVAQQSLS